MVVFDASILLFVLDENTPSSVSGAKARVEHLIAHLSDAGEKIVIPTPALSECLVYAGPAGAEYLAIIHKQACFRIVSFDERAAVEAAIRIFEARQRGQKKGGDPMSARLRLNSTGKLLRWEPSKAPQLFTRMTAMYAITLGRRV